MTFSSVYEMFDPLTTVRKQHVWDWFNGSDLHSRWTKTDGAGTGTYAMADSIDGGFSVTSGGTIWNNSSLNFNQNRQYAHDGVVVIMVAKRSSAGYMIAGLNDNNSAWDSPYNEIAVKNLNTDTYFRIISSDSTTQTETDSTKTIDTSWHNIKLTATNSNLNLTIDGVSVLDKTTNRPIAKMQPLLTSTTSSGGAPTNSYRYFEAYNT